MRRPAEPIEDSPLGDALHGLLRATERGGNVLQRELERLEQRFGAAVYSAFLHLLSHLSFEPDEAKRLWKRIAEHGEFMRRRLGDAVDPRVALVSYFVEVNRKLQQPKIIELRLFEQTRASAYRDELTRLYNYRFFDEHLPKEIARAERQGEPLSLLMVDVDDFKPFNDRHGHAEGNAALAAMADVLREATRAQDLLARYGGEEFALILPATSKPDARDVAERVRRAVERHRFRNRESTAGSRLTVSIGVATYPRDAIDAADLLRNADGAMYVAKSQGRNRVQLYGCSSRSFRRVKASLSGEIRLLASNGHVLRTFGVGEGGMRFHTSRELPEGSFVVVTLALPHSVRPVRVCGVVLRCKPTTVDRFEATVRFTDLSSDDHRRLGVWVREHCGRVDGAAPGTG